MLRSAHLGGFERGPACLGRTPNPPSEPPLEAHRPRHCRWLVMASLVCVLTVVPAEASEDFLLIFPHTYHPPSADHPNRADQGLWRWSPGGSLQRLATFFYNPRPVSFDSWDLRAAAGSYLSFADGQVFFAGAPVFQLLSWPTGKVLLRRGTLSSPGSSPFCVIQGPALGAAEATQLGFLGAGILGLVQAGPGYNFQPCGLESHMFWFQTVSGVVSPVPIDGNFLNANEFLRSNLLAFDSKKQGLWAIPCTDRRCPNIVFLPITGGHLRFDPQNVYPLPPLTSPCGVPADVDLHALLSGPETDSLYLLVASSGPSPLLWLLQLEPASQRCSVVAPFPRRDDQGPAGTPHTVTPLPPLVGERAQLVPIVAHASGKRGTFWKSTLWLYNPQSAPTTVGIARVSQASSPYQITLPARGSLKIEDVLGFLGGGPAGDGITHDALVVTSRAAGLAVASRTFTPAPGYSNGGTMGHAVVAIPAPYGYSNHLPSLDYGLRYDGLAHEARPSVFLLDWRDVDRYRHNLGVVNSENQPLTVTLSWRGRPIAERTLDETVEQVSVTVPPRTVRLFPVEDLFNPARQPDLPAVLVVTAPRPAPVFLSQVDNLTGDGNFVPYSGFTTLPGDDTAFVLPVVAKTTGDNGSTWQTTLYRTPGPMASWLVLGNGTAARYQATFYPERPCQGLQAVVADLEGSFIFSRTTPHSTETLIHTLLPDLVAAFSPCASEANVKGGMLLRVGNWTEAYSRTFTTREDGGTFGEMLPLYPERGYPEQHFAGIEVSPQFRVNVGFFNAQARAQNLLLNLYAADGSLAASQTLTLAPWQSLQQRLEDLFHRPRGSFPHGTYGLSVLPQADPPTGEEGRSWAYVSLVDNVTNDPTNWW